MAPSRGPVMAEIAVITCAVMSLIAGGTSVMDLIHCDEFIAHGHPALQQATDEQASRRIAPRSAHSICTPSPCLVYAPRTTPRALR